MRALASSFGQPCVAAVHIEDGQLTRVVVGSRRVRSTFVVVVVVVVVFVVVVVVFVW